MKNKLVGEIPALDRPPTVIGAIVGAIPALFRLFTSPT